MAKKYYYDGKLYKPSEWDHKCHCPLPKQPKAKKVEPVKEDVPDVPVDDIIVD